MRYLNKIVLINSASVAYSEVMLGGNTHFIGTQGVGKSTLLRAILFFYNADTQKLGIKTGQKSFYEHYFPYDNSYIIYEVAKETGHFCILCYKNTGKICFRFFDGSYKKEYFLHQVENTNKTANVGANAGMKAYENWEKIKEQFSKNNVISSNKIDRYELYRDILYGNSEGKKEFRKYAFLESKQYQNIPRTIQNVFLNAELKAEFIKETIIKSLNDEDVSIRLDIYAKKLQTFKAQYDDILKWNQKDKNGEMLTQKQAIQIAKMHTELLFLEKQQLQLVEILTKKIESIKIEQPILEEKNVLEVHKSNILSKQLDELINIFEEREKQDLVKIGILEKEIYYNNLNINGIIEKAKNKNTLLSQQENFKNQKNLLESNFSDIKVRFEALLKENENQKNSFQNIKKEQKNAIQEDFLRFKEDINTKFFEQIKQIGEENKMLLEDAISAFDDTKTTISNLANKKTEILHQRYFEQEIESKKKVLLNLEKQKTDFENEIKNLQNKIQNTQNEQIAEEKDKNMQFERETERKNLQILPIQAEIEAITFKINNNTASFYGWLNENYEGWQHTIGKIIDEEILFNSSLSPILLDKIISNTTSKKATKATEKIVEKLAEKTIEKEEGITQKPQKLSFYGIELDFSEVKKISKTIAEYQKESEILAEKIEKIKVEITEGENVLEKDLKKIKTKFQDRKSVCRERV